MTSSTAGHTAYDVTKEGRVFSVAYKWRGIERRELVQDLNSHGYPSVRLTTDGKRVRKPVHVLVATKFLPPRLSPQHQVRHLDGNPLNNHADNLAWGTAKENAADRERHGRTSRGSEHSKAIRSSSHAANTPRGSNHPLWGIGLPRSTCAKGGSI
jgi:hypothetical protein